MGNEARAARGRRRISSAGLPLPVGKWRRAASGGSPHRAATVCFLLPALGLLTAFVAAPIVLTAWVSLHSGSMFTSYGAMTWAGLANYAELFQQSTFLAALRNTFVYAFGNIVIIVPLSVLLGILIYRPRLWGRNAARGLLFLPYMLPTVAVAIVWSYLYAPQYGPFNQILGWLHLPPQNWLNSIDQALFSLILLNVWQTLGYYVVMVLAGLTQIPSEYYEAASLDGAGPLQRHLRITVPLLGRTLAFVFVILTINTLQVFDPVYVLTQGGPVNATNVVSYHMYITAFNFGHAGLAGAMAIVLFAAVLLLSIAQLRLLRSI